MNLNYKYPDLERFSKDIGISKEDLVQAFEIEEKFHLKILNESDREKRKFLYKEVYERVHRIYGKICQDKIKYNIAVTFAGELRNRSILDLGCGDGTFLITIADRLGNNRLVGIDVSPHLPRNRNNIQFVNSDIIEFHLNERFDIVFSDNVLEHIAPSDLPIHLSSIKRALKENGKLIILMPNRLFGPSDITRAIDYSYTNQIEAMGTHINESTYKELIPILKAYGFRKFYAILPISFFIPSFPIIRLNTNIFIYIENSPKLINILHKIKYNKKCIARLPIILICE